MKTKKMRFLALLLSVLLMASMLPPSVFATQPNDTLSAKETLAKLHADEFMPNYASTDAAEVRDSTVLDLICKIQTGEIDEQGALDTLESNGIYKLAQEDTESNVATPASTSSNVVLNMPSVYYDSYNNQWIVSGGGYWSNDNGWINDAGFGAFASEKNIGSEDIVGVVLYNTSGTYSTRVVRSYAYYSDGTDESYNYNTLILNGQKGAAFEYQDKASYENGTYSYMGKHFCALVVYDSNFSSFHGYARTYYCHTWSQAEVTSIAFGASGNESTFEVNIANQVYSFQAYSGSEKHF